MFDMELVRGGDVDHVHMGIPTQGLRTQVRLPLKLALEFLQLAFVDIGGCGECDVRVLRERQESCRWPPLPDQRSPRARLPLPCHHLQRWPRLPPCELSG